MIWVLLAAVFAGCSDDKGKDSGDAFLTVSTISLDLKSEKGSVRKFSLTTAASWVAVATGDGFTLNKTSGTGSTEITVTATGANASAETALLGTIDVIATGVKLPWTIHVSQLYPGAPDPEEKVMLSDIEGQWHLTQWSVDSEFAGDVYLEIKSDRTFSLYQNLVSHGYEKLTGTFTLGGSGTISGKYDDGKDWGTIYRISDFSASSMTWVSASGNDTSVFTREAIPGDITRLSRAAAGDSGFRFL